VRIALRILAFLIAIPLTLGGVGGLALHQKGPALIDKVRERALAAALESPDPQAAKESLQTVEAGLAVLKGLPVLPLSAGLLAASICLLGFALRPGRKRAVAAAVPTGASPGYATEAQSIPVHSNRDRKKHLKVADSIREGGGTEAAARYLLDQELKDEAAELLIEAEVYDRAAEVRHDQNRFEEAAELYRRGEMEEAAGTIYAQIERFEDAAQCYLAVEKYSVAGEMFERAENFREAGRCYQQVGFHRHAAQAFLKSGSDLEAARALIAAFDDEGGGSGAQNEQKARELKGIARKAGELLTKLERYEEAEEILVRAGAFGRAAKVAFQLEAYDRAAELFLRVGRGDLAAKALERAGDTEAAERALGEYLREKGDEAEAVGPLEKDGEHTAAADLDRKLERFAEAAECYANAGDHAAAADMFRAADKPERAAEAFEACHQFEQAAECYELAGETARRASVLEKGGRVFEAGLAYAELDQPDEAIRLLQQVEGGNPHFGEACSVLGRIFASKGMDALSITKFEQAVGSESMNRANVEASYELGKALDSREEYQRSVEIYEKIMSFDYHFRDVAERLEAAKTALQQQEQQQQADAPQTTSPPHAQVQPGRYERIRELGRGGMGVVYLARDSVLEREVAYKILPEGLRENPNALKNFLREAKAAAQLNHPNIVTVYDAGESDDGFYLAMELVNGTTLKEVLQRRGPVAAGGVVYILKQMADALSYAHSRRVVHRDVKTANTMWTTDKQVKIMDFGLAKLMEEVRQATTLVSGTPFYMSPEQTLGRNVDHRTDIYSLGVTLFELATGQLPFQKGNVPYHHVHTAPPDPMTVKPDLPPALAKIILRCLEKDPDRRFASAREIIEEVERLSGVTPGP
jgi:tetratricopeptide (TPR) repeat protein